MYLDFLGLFRSLKWKDPKHPNWATLTNTDPTSYFTGFWLYNEPLNRLFDKLVFYLKGSKLPNPWCKLNHTNAVFPICLSQSASVNLIQSMHHLSRIWIKKSGENAKVGSCFRKAKRLVRDRSFDRYRWSADIWLIGGDRWIGRSLPKNRTDQNRSFHWRKVRFSQIWRFFPKNIFQKLIFS